MNSIDMRDAFFDELAKVAEHNDKIFILSADHGARSLDSFQLNNPKRYLNIGISEQSMVGVASGLALTGKIVFIYGITPFVSLRVLEQLTLDVAALQLPVNVISVGSGFTYSTDGQTHLGIQDVGVISTIPGMNILNSSDPANTRSFVGIAINEKKPNYIRIEKENLSEFQRLNQSYMHDGYSIISSLDSDYCLLTTGSLVHTCIEAVDKIEKTRGIKICLIDIHNLTQSCIDSLAKKLVNFKKIISIEEHYVNGLGSLLSNAMTKNNIKSELTCFGVDHHYVFQSNTRSALRKEFGLDLDSIVEKLNKYFIESIHI